LQEGQEVNDPDFAVLVDIAAARRRQHLAGVWDPVPVEVAAGCAFTPKNPAQINDAMMLARYLASPVRSTTSSGQTTYDLTTGNAVPCPYAPIFVQAPPARPHIEASTVRQTTTADVTIIAGTTGMTSGVEARLLEEVKALVWKYAADPGGHLGMGNWSTDDSGCAREADGDGHDDDGGLVHEQGPHAASRSRKSLMPTSPSPLMSPGHTGMGQKVVI